MADPEDVLSDSPADFDSSFAYALHGEMRRLLIVTILGALLFPTGLAVFLDSTLALSDLPELGVGLLGLGIAIVGAAFFFGGIVAVLFKTIADANIVATEATREE